MQATGRVAWGYETVRDVFNENFAERGDLGAACCVYVKGMPVVDLWGGFTEAERVNRWQSRTVVPVFSATKGALMACVNLLIERGQLDPDAPVTRYWPEFAANGKKDVLLRWVMSHQAGVPAVDTDVTLDEIGDWPTITAAVARQKPSWEPGTAHGYHPRSIGWILGEVIRRVTHLSPGTFFAQEIANPLGLDWWIGLPDEVSARLAWLADPPQEDFMSEGWGDLQGTDLRERALSGPSNLFAYDQRWNSPAYLRPEIPSSNGVANAWAIARMYASLIGEVDGFRVLQSDTVDRARAVQVDGPDLILGRRSSFGLGFSVYPGLGLNCPSGAFGHPGAGGSLGFADPESELSFGYVTNQMRLGAAETDRADALVEAVYQTLNKD